MDGIALHIFLDLVLAFGLVRLRGTGDSEPNLAFLKLLNPRVIINEPRECGSCPRGRRGLA